MLRLADIQLKQCLTFDFAKSSFCDSYTFSQPLGLVAVSIRQINRPWKFWRVASVRMPEANVGRKRHGEGCKLEEETEAGMGPQEKTEENERTVCDGVRGKRRAKRRTERAEASARSFPFRGRQGGRKGGGGANSRDINSVLALGGLHRRKLRAEGESIPFLPATNVYPSLRRSPFLPLLPPGPHRRCLQRNHPRRARLGRRYKSEISHS